MPMGYPAASFDSMGGEMAQPWEVEQQWLLDFARRLRSAASRRRMPLTELARRSGVPYYTLCGYVNQARRVPAYTVVRLARALDVPVTDLLDDGQARQHELF